MSLNEIDIPVIEFKGAPSPVKSESSTMIGNETAVVIAEERKRVLSEYNAECYYAGKQKLVEIAIAVCRGMQHKELDGEQVAYFVITQVDHFDHEWERLVFVMEKSLLVFNFNFCTLKLTWFKRLLYSVITQTKLGTFVYPGRTLLDQRPGLGLMINFTGTVPVRTIDLWNPVSHNIPWLTFCSHPLLSRQDASKNEEPDAFDIEKFAKCLHGAIQYTITPPPSFLREFIETKCRIGLTALIHNQSSLGFARDRGGVSY